MKRIAILTAGGDTPALNATLHGAATRANRRQVELVGLVGGFSSLLLPRTPYVMLNPLWTTIPELDPTKGGTILGSTREYLRAAEPERVAEAIRRLDRLQIEGLICVGGDGTLNGLQILCNHLPVVLAPKTIDNDLGLNYPDEIHEWEQSDLSGGAAAQAAQPKDIDLDQMVNYVTPGYATAVYVAAAGVQRIRTTAESHRRIAIIEVMGRQSGYIALGAAYGQPDLILVPESPLDEERLIERTRQVYASQQNVVIVCGEGIVDAQGRHLGLESRSRDPAGNIRLHGAADAVRQILIDRLGDELFALRYCQSAADGVFIRKVGHTQRGGRPLLFDRFYAAALGGQAVDLLEGGANNVVATLQWNRTRGFYLDSAPSAAFRDRWGVVHPRTMHPSFYDAERLGAATRGIEYLLPIFTAAIGADDVEAIRQTLFDSGNLTRPYHSVNVDIQRRIQYAD